MEIEVEMIKINKDTTLDRHKIDAEKAIEEAIIGKAMVETLVENEVDRILEEIIVMTEAGQEKEVPYPKEKVIDGIIAQAQT